MATNHDFESPLTLMMNITGAAGRMLPATNEWNRASADVKAMAISHVAGLKAKIAELQAMAQNLELLAEHCHGNDRSNCPILADLAERTAAAVAEQRSQAPHRPPRFGIDTPASSRHRAATVTHS